MRIAGGTSPRCRRAEVAAQQYDDEFLGYDSPHDRSTVAELPNASIQVGFVIPARNPYNPHHRLHRRAAVPIAAMAMSTRSSRRARASLAADHALAIRASTDLGNVPDGECHSLAPATSRSSGRST